MVTMPEAPPPRDIEAWSKSDAAARLRAARRSPKTRHLCRLILIGLRTGSRPGAIMKMRWVSSAHAGWFDLENGIMYRRGSGEVRSKKRQPPCRIHTKLLPHLRRWKRLDEQRGITRVVHYQGLPVLRVKHSWEGVRRAARYGTRDTPHVLRHSAVTWWMHEGIDIATIGGYVGMTPEILWSIYGHHHPRWQADIANAPATPQKRANRK
jgi:integrase